MFLDASKIPIARLDHSQDYYNSIIMCGMGGSGTPCDIVNTLLTSDAKIPSEVIKGGTFPLHVDKKSLVIVYSVSGETRETIQMMKEASKRGAETISISSGGEIKEIANREGHAHIAIPNIMLPRASLPYLLVPSLKLIDDFLTHSIRHEIQSVFTVLSDTRQKISVRSDYEHNVARRISEFIMDGLPFCLTSPILTSVGTRFKNSLNENAKTHCISESVLEASHNEIVPFTFEANKTTQPILLLNWIADNSLVRERFSRISTFFKNINRPFMELTIEENSAVNAIISSLYILDYSTIYLAISKNIDPSPTPAIDILKKNV